MRKFCFSIVLLSLFMISGQQLGAQTDYYFNKYNDIFRERFTLNPAETGLAGINVFDLGYSARFLAVDYYPRDINLSWDNSFGKDKVFSLGVMLNNFRDPFTTTYTANISAGLNFELDKDSRLRWGISLVDYSQVTDSMHKMLPIDHGDPVLFQHGAERDYYNFSTGIWYEKDNFYTGLSIINLIRLNNILIEPETMPEDDFQMPWALSFLAGYNYEINWDMALQSSCTVILNAGKRLLVSPSIFINYQEKYIVGLNYNNLSIISVSGGVQFLDKFHFGASLGVPTNRAYKISIIGLAELKLRATL